MSSSYNDFGASRNSEIHGFSASHQNDSEHSVGARTERINSEPKPTGLDALPTHEFLRIVGLRVRARRTDLGMSRKRLAEVSGVSERYLAQLESGQGNMSIALLRKVTVSIGMSLSALLSAEMLEESPIKPNANGADPMATSDTVHAHSAKRHLSQSNELHPTAKNADDIVRSQRLIPEV